MYNFENKNMKNTCLLFLLVYLCFTCLQAEAQSGKDDFTLCRKSAQETGDLLAKRFLQSEHMLHGGKWIHYAEVCTWYGALKYATITGDDPLTARLKDRFESLFGEEKNFLPPQNHVDLNMFGCLPLEFFRVSKEQKYFDLGMPYADSQWQLPTEATPEERTWSEKGLSWQTRMWIDDMYMITIIQAQAYRTTGKREYIDRAAYEMVAYLDSLQRPNGLFYHAPDVPFYWARGNGWMAVGMTELLRALPEDSPYYPHIMEGYRTMMNSLKTYQRPDGMWNQLVDKADCWAESSGSAMFAYAFITGVKKGWLPDEYAPAALSAWKTMQSFITPEGDITEVCVGTNKKNDLQYYYDRPRRAGDFHGQAPYLWCVYALLED